MDNVKGGADPMIGNLMRKIEETIEEEEYLKREAIPAPPLPPGDPAPVTLASAWKSLVCSAEPYLGPHAPYSVLQTACTITQTP